MSWLQLTSSLPWGPRYAGNFVARAGILTFMFGLGAVDSQSPNNGHTQCETRKLTATDGVCLLILLDAPRCSCCAVVLCSRRVADAV